MARLLEGNDKGCTAIFCNNGKIFFADNNINTSITKNEKVTGLDRVALIDSVMEHFSNVANGTPDKQAREQLFIDICYKKIREEGAGYIKLSEETIKNMARDLLNKCDVGQKYILDKSDRTSRPYKVLAHVFGTSLLTDFIKVEAFIEEYSKAGVKDPKTPEVSDKEKEFIVALRSNEKLSTVLLDDDDTIKFSDYNLMHGDSRPGYVILATDRAPKPKQKLVHAEGKVLNYLLFTRKYDEFYEGLSKLCCLSCGVLHEAANASSLKMKNSSEVNLNVIVRGEHNYYFETGTPLLLLPSSSQHSDIGKFINNEENIPIDSTSAKNIQTEYNLLFEQKKLAFDDASKAFRKAITAINTNVSKLTTLEQRIKTLMESYLKFVKAANDRPDDIAIEKFDKLFENYNILLNH